MSILRDKRLVPKKCRFIDTTTGQTPPTTDHFTPRCACAHGVKIFIWIFNHISPLHNTLDLQPHLTLGRTFSPQILHWYLWAISRTHCHFRNICISKFAVFIWIFILNLIIRSRLSFSAYISYSRYGFGSCINMC